MERVKKTDIITLLRVKKEVKIDLYYITLLLNK